MYRASCIWYSAQQIINSNGTVILELHGLDFSRYDENHRAVQHSLAEVMLISIHVICISITLVTRSSIYDLRSPFKELKSVTAWYYYKVLIMTGIKPGVFIDQRILERDNEQSETHWGNAMVVKPHQWSVSMVTTCNTGNMQSPRYQI